MKVAQINMFPYGSTGNIMHKIAETARQEGHKARTYSTIPYDKDKMIIRDNTKDSYIWGSFLENKLHCYLAVIFGRNGCFSHFGTWQLIKELKDFKPDIIHLHNLHKFCINLPMLFNYIKKNNIAVVWTLHDCWAFTGQCPHFTLAKCDKWRTGCYDCPQINVYPKSLRDNSKRMYKLKKKWFTNIKNMTLVTPSEWLAGLVKQSFLKDYPVKVINNAIDLNVFKPTESDFRKKYNCENKYMLLGVAFGWGKRKGLDVFIELSKRLNDNYQIVLIGTDSEVDKQLPDNIITIHKTQNQTELAEIYTAADLFVNPTREENYPTVNMEAIACGTPVLTFRTGGSPETIDRTCGSVVDCDDIDALEQEISRICVEKTYSTEACLRRAKKYDMNEKYKEYIKLYEDCTHSAQCTL